ncbi:MAG: TetR/AcrR family transcriptional regulator [Flavobacteriales bacterium]|nr:TetR/AcrR family transcriptional regulator [Flavobacteriales bacterium]MCB9167144.1 TetR/AcrR family transcriptional regulator [Flavobacteriales bacterium]
MDERGTQIIDQAGKVFMRLGIRSVNMDDIAQHLRISKKTLYQYVKDKNDLVSRAVELICTHHRTSINAICERGMNAIDENFEIAKFLAAQLSQMHPSIHFDLQKYHAEAWDLLDRTEKADIERCVTLNMQKGIGEGLYRADLNIPVIAKIYIARFDATFDGELFPASEYNFQDVIWEMFRYHIRGIASDKGLKYLERKVKKERTHA